MNGRCVNCDHWHFEEGCSNGPTVDAPEETVGTCERFPPTRDMDVRMGADGVNGQPIHEAASDDWSAWKQPLTGSWMGCGEFKQRADDGEVPT